MKVSKAMVISVILVVLALGGGFFAGMQYQKSRPSFMMTSGFGGGQYGQFRGRFAQGGGQGGNTTFRPVRGQVLSVDANGLTVKLPDGSSKIVVISSSTNLMKSAPATSSDITAGETVTVIGTQNSDGSITASNVQINPQMSPTPTSAQ